MPTKQQQTKQRMASAPQIIDFGSASDLTWPGMVSARSLIKSGTTSRKIINDAIERLNEFYVPVHKDAKTRCIDGRHDPKLDEKHLGPQVPGGTPGAALAYRLGVEEDDLGRGTFLTDAEAMIGSYVRLGFAPGGHRDEHSIVKSSVGCGAIDGMDRILATMIRPDLASDHRRVVELLLGDTFNQDSYSQIMGAAVALNGRSEEYFSGREAIMDYLEKRYPDSVATLQGDHQECLAIINLVAGTTLASNRLATTFDGMQAFGFDLWRTIEIANKLLPRADQAQAKERFVLARVMTGVATLMALTDASQNLILRTPT